ncbi:hypothetical protein [Methanolobus sp. ZRKC5]|uniref:hypothetical protein n=1 Tax=unclassified Methanolobus TaxID=2629569 RepID=UPI00313D447D
MRFIKHFFNEQKKEKAINKKLKTVKENKAIAVEKKQLVNLGLSEDEAEFKARKNLKRAKQKETVNSVISGLSNAVDTLDMGPEIPAKTRQQKSSSRSSTKNKSKKKGRPKQNQPGQKGRGGSNPLEMDLPGFEL